MIFKKPNKFQVIIPTYNDSDDILPLLKTLPPNLPTLLVDDGSTEEHREKLDSLGLEVLRLPQNQGRYLARLKGAEYATSEFLIFCDVRVSFPPQLLSTIEELSAVYPCLMANLEIDSSKNIYNLYWEKSHRWFFSEHFQKTSEIQSITKENFASFLKGTTFLVVKKEVFLQACSQLQGSPENDDTPLLFEICKITPITLHPKLRVHWRPRQNLTSFLTRLWKRGPGFVEYYAWQPKHFLFYWLWFCFLSLNLFLFTSFLIPLGILALLPLTFMLVLAWHSVRMAKEDFFVVYPLHCLSVITFGFSVFCSTWIFLGTKFYELARSSKG